MSSERQTFCTAVEMKRVLSPDGVQQSAAGGDVLMVDARAVRGFSQDDAVSVKIFPAERSCPSWERCWLPGGRPSPFRP